MSVIINNFNYGTLIGEAIDSALRQSAPDVEVIVVDDGSTDGSIEVIDGYGSKIRRIYQPNGGQAAAINAGVRASRGEILCFLDADDWWAEDKVAAVVEAFAADPGAALVYHRQQPVQSDGTYIMKPLPTTLCSGDLSPMLRRSAGFWPFPLTSAIALRRSAWDAVGDIPETFRISADAWLVGIYPFIGRVSALPSALGFYRVHGNNNWTRLDQDAAHVRKCMAHWRKTVETTDQFLEARGIGASLQLKDHFPYRVFEATLNGCGLTDRVTLAWKGMLFQGEPNLLRRTRNAFRAALTLPSTGIERSASEPSR
ncbi:glycosyltransferase [Tropicimonas isoalkanivorans]|uniref:glycosyltransferase n=1 Tax=Tropicimonas isoalkanivorans TaxID=441112 RepID=UPI001C431560|nr:glycosyltransferase [Tropicimonas isoalkanivorans]